MMKNINGLGTPPTTDPRTRAQEAVSTPRQTATPTPTQQARAAEDMVRISPQAAQMKALESKLAKQPEVDSERVQTIRKAIAEGRYPVDAERLAQKLLDLDAQLGD